MHVEIYTERMNVVPLSTTDGHSHDNSEFRKVLNPKAGRVKMVCSKGVYDSRCNFNFLHNKGNEAVIPPREKSTTLSRGPPSRVKKVRRIMRH